MVSHISTIAFWGIEVKEIDVQVHISTGLPAFCIVGLPDKTVKESTERVRAAFSSMGLSLPCKRVTINLAPADLQKEGSHYDLAIALGLMVEMGLFPMDTIENFITLGELALDGALMPISGTLPAAIHASSQHKGIICPEGNGGEARWAGDIPILAAPSLLTLLHHFKGTQLLSRPEIQIHDIPTKYGDMNEVKGQEIAKRALEIVAAGGHNMLMVGPPGSGKSMLASRLPGLLPPLDAKEMLEVSMIASVSGSLKEGKLQKKRPFRDPHHTCSPSAMAGGGKFAKPGEMTLAHHGVLFLDELPEFGRDVIETLRQPMETAQITIARVHAHVTYPARFQLIAAMNPCRCGYVCDAARACSKAPRCANDYQAKISGPFKDRIDIHLEVSSISPSIIEEKNSGEASAVIAKRVAHARLIQKQRYLPYDKRTNAEMDTRMIEKYAIVDPTGKSMLEKAITKFGLTMRGYHRILRVARTIADLECSETLQSSHIAEALSYRVL